MTAPERGFPDDEFAARCAAMQAAMAREGVDAMLFASEPEIRYFTGFLTPFWQSPTRPWFLVLPPEGKPVAVIPSIGGPLMRSCYAGEVITRRHFACRLPISLRCRTACKAPWTTWRFTI